jgi:branched-chain amino acid transport system permease protein
MPGAIYVIAGLLCTVAATVFWSRRDATHSLVTSYGAEHRRFRTLGSKVSTLIGLILLLSAPVGFSWIGFRRFHLPTQLIPGLPLGESWLFVGVLAGIYTIGAIGMNLLIGNTGQVSLGHSGFVLVGAYSTGYFGQDLTIGGKHLPSLVWVMLAGILGAIISAAIGPFALRLRGNYLAMVSIFIVLAAGHIAKSWISFTGGDVNPRNDLPGFVFTVWPGKSINFNEEGSSNFFNTWFLTKNQGYFWLCWAFAIIAIIIGRNLTRSRQGRAMMAVRDRDLSAEVIGVRQMYTKTWAFAISGAFAAVAGALYASFFSSVQPSSFALLFSVQFIAMIVIGGVGSIYGSVLGAIVIAALLPLFQASEKLLKGLPLIQLNPSKPTGLTLTLLSTIVYGLALILFLMFFPTGLAGLWAKVRRYFATWPFS